MKIALVNPPHTAIGSRVPNEHLPPFGLLCLGGPLIDAGFDVELINADIAPLSIIELLARLARCEPDAVLIGHSGSTTAHPTAAEICRLLKEQSPGVQIVYGGVFPTYHWRDVLNSCPSVDYIVRGEGEETAVALMKAIRSSEPISDIRGIAYHDGQKAVATPPARVIADLDANRIGWELIDFDDHSYWGGKKAVIMQFSRGCPHLCTYCGQRGFWTKWRHRDPVKFAREIAFLVREHGVELINLADENPTSSRRQWKLFLEALIAENVRVTLIGSTRADDIVRDADILHLYKKAGVLRFLMGLEGTDEKTLAALKKGGTRQKDQEAIRLLREHGMIGLCTFGVGFDDETDADYWRMLRTLLRYDPDQVMSIYATPHQWTPFFSSVKDKTIVQADVRRWDYKHQVLKVDAVPPWRLFLWVKFTEFCLQMRPKALWRTYLHPDPEIKHAMRWYSRMGRRVVLREVFHFLFKYRRAPAGTVAEFWKSKDELPGNAMTVHD